jgi:hypothetical protein
MTLASPRITNRHVDMLDRHSADWPEVAMLQRLPWLDPSAIELRRRMRTALQVLATTSTDPLP